MAYGANDAGIYNRRITILAKAEVETEYGTTSIDWQPIYNCWACIIPARGRDYYEAQKVRNTQQYKFIIRYPHKDIDEKMKVQYKGQEYDIITVINPYMADRTLELLCEHKNKGDKNG